MSETVIVLGDTVTALSTLRAVRPLKKEGFRILSVATSLEGNYAYRSNIPDRKVIFQNGLIDGLLRMAGEFHTKPILLFNRDDEVVEISVHRERLEPFYNFLLPDQDTVALLMEKSKFTEFARCKELPLPKTIFIETEAELLGVEEAIPFPIIVKPYLLHAIRVDDQQALLALADKLQPIHYQSMIAQEYIEGKDDRLFFCFLLFDRQGKLVRSMSAKKLRQWPLSYGTTSLAETLEDPNFRKEVDKFIEVIDGIGFCSIEFKYHPPTDRYLIMEPTVGRFNQQIALSVAAGVNIPLAMVRLLTGQRVETKRQRNKVRWIFESNDLLSRMHSGNQYGYLGNFLKAHSKVLFSWKDPMPFFFEIYSMGRKKLRKILKHV